MVAELELLRLIDLIYQGALDAGCWANAIAEVGRAFGGEVSSLSLYERPSRALRYQLELDTTSPFGKATPHWPRHRIWTRCGE